MKKYEKPIVMINEDLAEGVYAASGCWTANGAGTQNSITSRGDFRFQINGSHMNEAHAASVYITFTFNEPVKYAEFCGYTLLTDVSAGAKVVVFELTNYANNGVNPNENFGGGALNVQSFDETLTSLTLEHVVITDGGAY